MCGIVVALSPRGMRVASLVEMTRVLRHRGPDDEGYLVGDGDTMRALWGRDTPADVRSAEIESRPQAAADDLGDHPLRLGFGHRRLAIVDLSPQGHQPMRRGSLSIVFNGEIYDHIEQRSELARLGHRFTSGSDTEVLLAAYAQWGVDAFRRINGMWSLAIHDSARRKLIVARDRYGVKPLYWWQGGNGELAMASEIKALLKDPRMATRADVTACETWMRAGPQSWQAETLFEGIRSFPAGHWAEVALDAPQALQPQRYWLAPGVSPDRLDEPYAAARADSLAEEYRALLGDAVRVRMRMDVRFGTALSGGLDSSQIAMLVNSELRSRGTSVRQEVFSSVYPGATVDDSTREDFRQQLRSADESAFIASVARQLDVRSNVIEPNWRDIPVEHERMIWAVDLPPINTLMSSWHTYALVARRGVIVTLDGQGADEQLAGYVYYARNLLMGLGAAAAARQAFALTRRLQGIGPMVALGLLANAIRQIVGAAGLKNLTERLGRGKNLSLSLEQALREDFTTHLQTLLFYADKSSMAWSIESRMPFMDWRLVNFLTALPLAYRIHDGWTKWLARHAMQKQLPSEVVWRRDKLGWAIPEAAWFGPGGPLRQWMQQQVRSSAFATQVAASCGIDFDAADLASCLRLLNLAVWHRLFFEEPGRPGRLLGRQREIGVA